jgi:hypothetical protein
VATASYVGSKGTHLTMLNDLNQLLPVPASANPYKAGEAIGANGHDDCGTMTTPSGVAITGQAAINLGVACGGNADVQRTVFPGLGDIFRLQDTANSVYHALQTTTRRTVGDLTLSVAYTYSHAIDDSSDRFDNNFVNSFDIRGNRGNSSFDQRHNLAVSYVYALPLFRGKGLGNTLLGGWQVSGITIAQTGTPFSVTNGTNFGDNAGVGNGVATAGSRPDLVGNPHSGFSPNQDPANRGPLAYNPAAFATPTGLTFGNVGRNTLYLPGRVNFDLGVFKRFSINEKTGFDFRWETFNLFNHTQFGNGTGSISSGLGSSDFLHLTSAHAPRRMQFGLRFYF